MCSLAGDSMIEEKPEKKLSLENCKKCQSTNTAIVLRKIDVYCKSCFLIATTHKFRAMLGKHRVVNANDRVLIVHRTGQPSTALLHFLRTGLDESQHKKLRFTPVVLYIDGNDKISWQEKLELFKNFSLQVSSFKFPFYVTSLYKYMDNLDQAPDYYEINENHVYIEDKFTTSNLKQIDKTQYQDIFDISRRKLIISIAKKLDCKVVFTPELSKDVAIEMLSHISLGRGAQIPLNVGVCDDRDPDTKIFKPLRLFEMKELAYYNIFNNLEPINIKVINDVDTQYASVQNLMKKFVEDLQVNYPSTIKTVTRTGDKLKCDRSNSICEICKAPMTKQNDLSSTEATEFSRWVSSTDSAKIEQFKNIDIMDKNICFACSKITNIVGEKYFISNV